jgi:hypothetical protein
MTNEVDENWELGDTIISPMVVNEEYYGIKNNKSNNILKGYVIENHNTKSPTFEPCNKGEYIIKRIEDSRVSYAYARYYYQIHGTKFLLTEKKITLFNV